MYLPAPWKRLIVQAAGSQEVTISNPGVQSAIYNLLVYKKKGRGRCLKKAFPDLGLVREARLEPSATLPDVAMFESMACPFTCTFYVGGRDGRVLHESPFLKIPGVGLGTWCIDLLHSWHFGPMSTYITHTLRLMLGSSVWKPSIPDLDADERNKLALMALKAELWTHYKMRRANDPTWSKKGSEAREAGSVL